MLPVFQTAACPVYINGTGESTDLAGVWKFKAGHMPGAERISLDDSNWPSAKLPARYSKLGIKNGHAWFRCTVYYRGRVKPENPVAVSLGKTREADEVYFNGVLIGQTGNLYRPAVDLEADRLYPVPSELWQEQNTLAIRTYGSGPSAGIDEIKFVPHAEELNRSFFAHTLQSVFSIYYLLTAVYFLSFVFLTGNRLPNLFLGLFSLCLGLYSLIRAGFRYDFFDSFTYSYSFELVILFLMPVLFLNYMVSWIGLARPVWLKILELLYAALIIFTIAISFLPGNTSAWFSIVIYLNLAGLVFFLVPGVYLFFKHYPQNPKRLRYIGIGFLMLLPPVINDMLSTLEVIHTPRVMVYGFSVFLGFLALQLSEGIFELGEDLALQQQELRKIDKRKANTIYEISNEFQVLFHSILDALNPEKTKKSKKSSKKAAAKKTRKSAKKKTASSAVTKQISAKEKHRLESTLTNLENLVRDSHILASLEDGSHELKNVRFSVAEAVNESAQRALLTTMQSPQRLILRIPDTSRTIRGDYELFTTAVFHPLENALLYSGGDVELIVTLRDNGVLVTVRDEGPGIESGLRNVVFDKFIRGYEHQDITGSGIGLTIVQWIADYTGGFVNLDTSPGFYTSLEFFYPDAQTGEADA